MGEQSIRVLLSRFGSNYQIDLVTSQIPAKNVEILATPRSFNTLEQFGTYQHISMFNTPCSNYFQFLCVLGYISAFDGILEGVDLMTELHAPQVGCR